MVDARGIPNPQDINAFDTGYMLGYIHALEQIRLALTSGETYDFSPQAHADRISGLIASLREDFNERDN